jgi:hypothetical protein
MLTQGRIAADDSFVAIAARRGEGGLNVSSVAGTVTTILAIHA